MDEKTTGDSIPVRQPAGWRPAGWLSRLVRLLLRRNELRRGCDRIEGAILASLSVAFLTAIVVAALLAAHVYQSQHAAAARLRPSVAVVSAPGPLIVGIFVQEAQVTWRLADGAERTGVLTSATVPAIYDARTGNSVPVWLNASGDVRPPPPSQYDIILNMLLAATMVLAGTGVLLACCYWLCRLALDRHRLARWGQAWTATGPQWTSRQ
jgi:hypothetical protein